MHMVHQSCVQLYLFILFFGAMHNYHYYSIFITMAQILLIHKESDDFITGDFLGDFWPV